ncbi:MAG: dTDP-4-dehydrorhamnose reductase [Hyphomicrobiaceae bacterium]
MTSGPIGVIGATGQVSMALQRAAAKRGVALVAKGRPDIDVSNLESMTAFFERVSPRIVINAAAYTAVDKAEAEGQEEAFQTNAEAPARLAVLCKTYNIPLVHISTDYVFNGLKGAPYSEDDEICPVNCYGASKAAGEMAIRASGAQHVILRTQWVYGVDGANFVKTMLRLGAERDELGVVGDQLGAPTSADDIASALMDVCATLDVNAPADHWGTFHFVNAGITSWHGFATLIFGLATQLELPTPKLKAITTLEYPTPATRPPAGVLSTEKIQNVYAITPRPWEDALKSAFPEIVESMKKV